jgi:hypothetical protein
VKSAKSGTGKAGECCASTTRSRIASQVNRSEVFSSRDAPEMPPSRDEKAEKPLN